MKGFMNKTMKSKKLRLSHETLRRLDASSLDQVRGGFLSIVGNNCGPAPAPAPSPKPISGNYTCEYMCSMPAQCVQPSEACTISVRW